MAANIENPILLVQSRKQDLKQRVIEGFGEPKEIVEVTAAFRKALVKRISKATQDLQRTFTDYPSIPAVVALRLHVDAMAKSHRPILLLDRVGMRPIGTRRFGELLLPATANSLWHLAKIAEENESKAIRANLSTIDEISPWGIEDALGWSDLGEKGTVSAKHSLAAWIKAGKPLLLERFTSEEQATNTAIEETIRLKVTQLKVAVGATETHAAGGAATFIRVASLEAAMMLAICPAVRLLVPADEFSPIEIRPQMFADIGPAPA